MPNWSLDDIAWQEFDREKITPDLVSLVKAACMVEHNGYDYARYLCSVFSDDTELQKATHNWAQEEVLHGMALRKWAELADPAFDFDASFRMFTEGYKLPLEAKVSIRGSRCGELLARCIVETGTSAYYTAIKDHTREPVLKALSTKIAADEFRHYKMFYTHLQRYLRQENLGKAARFRIAVGRMAESEDDELAYAYYAAHAGENPAAYDRKRYARDYFTGAAILYRKCHIDRMTAMLCRAVGLKPDTLFSWVLSR